MQRYDSYKDSGIQWLGEIPSHWEIIKLKYTSDNIFTGCSPEYSLNENEHLIIGQRNNQLYHIDFSGIKYATDRFYSSRSESEFLRYGDVLLNTLGGGSVGRAGYFDYCGAKKILTDGHLMVIRPKNYNNKYLSYFLISRRRFLELLASGSTNQSFFNVSDIKILKVPKPSIEEQNRIVQYLDTATAKIDEAIAQQQKMIDLLNERKQIIINNAVTKGLNPNAKMKPSGIDWIGNIPEHWEVGRLKTILKVKDKRNTDPNALLLSVFTAIGVRPRQELEERGNKATTVLNYKIVNKGDLIVNRLLAWMGAYGLSNHDGVTSPDYDVYSFHADVNKDYYETFFRNTQFKSDCYKYGHGIMMMRWRTYSDEFLNINVPIPPRKEQDEIYNYLKPMIEKIDSGVSNCSQIISFLQERKQIIINDVVTGKVKVL